MIHLSDEQIEDVLRGQAAEPADLHFLSRRRLDEMRAMRSRLQAAFVSQRPSDDLAQRIRVALASQAHVAARAARGRIVLRLWRPMLAAAAAVLMFAIPAGLYFRTPMTAAAAQSELVRIHRDNLRDAHDAYYAADPEKLAEYLKQHLGYAPVMPCATDASRTTCCCVTTFGNRRVGSYVVQTPAGRVSVIVLPANPDSLGFSQTVVQDGRTYWLGRQGDCNMATVRLNALSYCAVGQPSHEQLRAVLDEILAAAAT